MNHNQFNPSTNQIKQEKNTLKTDIRPGFFEQRSSPLRQDLFKFRPEPLSHNGSVVSDNDFGMISNLSPVLRYNPFSPVKNSSISFYESFTKRFENRRNYNEEQAASPKAEFKAFNKVNYNPQYNFGEDPEKLANPNIFNFLQDAGNSFKDLMSDKISLNGDNYSPLRIELWQTDRINSGAISPVGFRRNLQIPGREKDNSGENSFCIRPAPIPDEPKDEYQLCVLKNIFVCLDSIFINNMIRIQHLQNLNSFEEEILNSLLQRKFSKKLVGKELEKPIEQRLDLYTQIINSKSNKRPEECYKFILTRVIKNLKKQLKEGNNSLIDSEPQLYEIYFKETAEKLGVPLTDLHYPLTGKRQNFKLNSVYFDKIFKSEKFIDAVKIYMKDILIDEYRQEIGKKIEALLIRWEPELQDISSDKAVIEKNIKEYLLKNKRCKLPWTVNEVKDSISRFITLMNNYRAK